MGVVGRERLRGGHIVQLLEIFLRDFVTIIGDQRGDTRVGGADMRAGNGQIDLGDHDVGFLLGLGQRIAHATLGDLEVDNLALADLPRSGLADTQQRQRAIGPDFSHSRDHLGAADFKCDDDVA